MGGLHSQMYFKLRDYIPSGRSESVLMHYETVITKSINGSHLGKVTEFAE